ncbi:dicarboxylate/amino acid:cation symporter [Bacillus badius]|uniref:Proton/sodium-glutamate symport protein n=1 Tax=Bacillus badius TaxID=1455 RepID=A0ABR5AVJ0_BACBA|nr:dicarboxylate/amino acid:cation symporter [Bacillus badius]KIL78769.1 Proton/sodium-glutamate symport protein [Bacillus badius]KZN98410.1 sodium:proton antiporter [Bacillus badius]KZR57667.1 sodium:proton antiporter [Bacillus badius]MED0666902.1 dicarboxylate/amino acid:cation symporter [Bacillus badius]MED4715935.1 dicarboxylate/amino acid:cation symporter [Bacillus badius]
MKRFLKSYQFTFLLLSAILLGGIAGVLFGPKAAIVKPLGDLFLNLMFMVIIPLVFFSISSAIASMDGMKRLGKIMAGIVIVFLTTAAVAAVIGLAGTFLFNPLAGTDLTSIKEVMDSFDPAEAETEKVSLAAQLVNTFTVNDFSLLLSKSNMLQLIVFSILFGLATAMTKEKGKPVADFLASGTAVMMKIVSIIMYYAPIGLGCYFAAVIGELGPQILSGYARTFVLYLGLTALYYFVFFTLYAFIAGGKDGVKVFWKHAAPPSITAIATCSSAASIPVNLTAAQKMGVPKDIAETVIPLGANTHKDGSVFGGVLKVVFLFALFGKDMTSLTSILAILGVSFLVGAVMGAIPGGGMIGEMLILSVFGFPPEALPIIAVISTIIDAPATLLNSTGNTVCAMLVTRFVEGKHWLQRQMSAHA